MNNKLHQELFTPEEWAALVARMSLPPRQSELAACLMCGFSDLQIARQMGITVPTVRTYMSRLFNRFEVQDRHELVLHIFREFRKDCRANGCPRCQ